MDSDCEREVSCFGAVSKSKCARRGHVRRHVRSKSFTNSTSSQQRHHQRNTGGGVMRRSSSADLLLRFSPVTSPKQEESFNGLGGTKQQYPKHEELIYLI